MAKGGRIEFEVRVRPRVVQIEPLHRAFCYFCGESVDGYASFVQAWADGHDCAKGSDERDT